MSVFLSTSFAPLGSRVSGVLTQLAGQGLLHVELGAVHCPEKGLAGSLERLPMRYLVHNNFPARARRFIINPASADAKIRKKSLAILEANIRFSARIGARLFTFHPGFVTDPVGEGRSPGRYDFRFPHAPRSDAGQRDGFDAFMESAHRLVRCARSCGVPLAVETQGAVTAHRQLIMQRPDELAAFTREFSPGIVGLNLNLGHLILASQVFGFDPVATALAAAPFTRAMELSHNDGVHDDHGPLRPDGWYWPLITDDRFASAFKIFEGRDLPLQAAVTMTMTIESRIAAE